jgi:hypothetical protein
MYSNIYAIYLAGPAIPTSGGDSRDSEIREICAQICPRRDLRGFRWRGVAVHRTDASVLYIYIYIYMMAREPRPPSVTAPLPSLVTGAGRAAQGGGGRAGLYIYTHIHICIHTYIYIYIYMYIYIYVYVQDGRLKEEGGGRDGGRFVRRLRSRECFRGVYSSGTFGRWKARVREYIYIYNVIALYIRL